MDRELNPDNGPDSLSAAASTGLLLPPLSKASGRQPRAGAAVLRGYKDALAIGDGVGLIEGYFAAFGTLILLASILGVYVFSQFDSWFMYAFGFLTMGLTTTAGMLMILFECTGYREQPTLFDRAGGRVYLMESRRNWFRPWTWFRIPADIQEFEWDKVRGMIQPIVSAGGLGIPRTNYVLRLLETESPGGDKVVASFGVGFGGVYDGDGEAGGLWEHLRRFMQEDGPHLNSGDEILVDDSTPSRLWNAIWWAQPLIGPGSKQYWINQYWFFTIPFGLLAFVILPLSMAGGLLRWLAYRCKRPAPWPPEVLARIGSELTEKEMRATVPKPGRRR